MAERRISEWRVHIGAHKAASTHLANSLRARSEDLAAQGVNYIPNRHVIRPAFARPPLPGHWRRRALGLLPAVRPVLMGSRAGQIRRAVQDSMVVPGAVVFSEENLLGGLGAALQRHLYADLSRLELLDATAKGAPVHLFLAIRSFDGYLPSVYAQMLKLAPVRRADLDRARAHWLAEPPSWYGLVLRLRRLLPRARLTVWDYADYRRNQAAILQAVTGVALAPAPALPPNTSTRTPGAASIAAAEALDLADEEARSRRVREIFAAEHALTAPPPRFDPLPDAEKAIFRDAFAADLARIDRDFPDMRLRFADGRSGPAGGVDPEGGLA